MSYQRLGLLFKVALAGIQAASEPSEMMPREESEPRFPDLEWVVRQGGKKEKEKKSNDLLEGSNPPSVNSLVIRHIHVSSCSHGRSY